MARGLGVSSAPIGRPAGPGARVSPRRPGDAGPARGGPGPRRRPGRCPRGGGALGAGPSRRAPHAASRRPAPRPAPGRPPVADPGPGRPAPPRHPPVAPGPGDPRGPTRRGPRAGHPDRRGGGRGRRLPLPGRRRPGADPDPSQGRLGRPPRGAGLLAPGEGPGKERGPRHAPVLDPAAADAGGALRGHRPRADARRGDHRPPLRLRALLPERGGDRGHGGRGVHVPGAPRGQPAPRGGDPRPRRGQPLAPAAPRRQPGPGCRAGGAVGVRGRPPCAGPDLPGGRGVEGPGPAQPVRRGDGPPARLPRGAPRSRGRLRRGPPGPLLRHREPLERGPSPLVAQRPGLLQSRHPSPRARRLRHQRSPGATPAGGVPGLDRVGLLSAGRVPALPGLVSRGDGPAPRGGPLRRPPRPRSTVGGGPLRPPRPRGLRGRALPGGAPAGLESGRWSGRRPPRARSPATTPGHRSRSRRGRSSRRS